MLHRWTNGSYGQVALPLAATILAWGRAGIAERVERCMAIPRRLAESVSTDERFELHSQSTTGVVAWRPRDVPATHVQTRMSGAFASLAKIDGETWMRSVCVNPHADVDRLIASAATALPPSRS